MSYLELDCDEDGVTYVPKDRVLMIEIIPTDNKEEPPSCEHEEHSQHAWYINVEYLDGESDPCSWHQCGFSTKREAKGYVKKIIYGTSKLKAERDMAIELITKRLQDRCDDLFTDVTQQDQFIPNSKV